MNVPQSLLVVALVVAWLVVLVPSSSRRRDHVKQTVEGRGFRVLTRAGTGSRALLRRRPTDRVSAGSTSSGGGMTEQEVQDRIAGESGRNRGADARTAAAGSTRYEPSDPVDISDPVDAVDDGADRFGADRFGADRFDADRFDADRFDADQVDTTVDRVEEVAAPASAGPIGRAASAVESDEYAEGYADEESGATGRRTDADIDEQVRAEYRAWRESTRARRPENEDDRDTEVMSPVRDRRRFDAETSGPGVERPIPRRSGRGTYDPEAAERARVYTYARRRRTLLVLVLVTLGLVLASSFVSSALWAGAGIATAVLVLFLFYLRRQARIEADIRARRLAKLERARQIRPERRIREEVSDPYRAAAASRVPGPHVHRGARVVVDLEDDDPGFDDLEYYEPVQYRRAVGQ